MANCKPGRRIGVSVGTAPTGSSYSIKLWKRYQVSIQIDERNYLQYKTLWKKYEDSIQADDVFDIFTIDGLLCTADHEYY